MLYFRFFFLVIIYYSDDLPCGDEFSFQAIKLRIIETALGRVNYN